jgi:hypothetical protein
MKKDYYVRTNAIPTIVQGKYLTLNWIKGKYGTIFLDQFLKQLFRQQTHLHPYLRYYFHFNRHTLP